MVDALQKSENELRNSLNEKVILMMTDGYPNSNSATLDLANRLTRQGYRIYAIGVGVIDFNFLRQMAGRENTLVIDSMDKLADAFKSVMNSIMLR